MNKEIKSEFLKEYERACDNFSQYFAAKYFGKDYGDFDMWWVAEEIGGVLHINDYFFNMDDMVAYVKYGYSKEKMFQHYEWAMEQVRLSKVPNINIKNWIKSKLA